MGITRSVIPPIAGHLRNLSAGIERPFQYEPGSIT